MATLDTLPNPFDDVEFHDNTSQVLIRITEDKLKNYLNEHLSKTPIKRAWIPPFGLILTFITTLATTDFKSAFYLSAANWKSLFILGLIASIIWAIVNVIRWLIYRKELSIDHLLNQIKNE